jgi:hypothetical protein
VRVEKRPKALTLFVIDKKGAPREVQDKVLRELEGIGGTWRQVKTL